MADFATLADIKLALGVTDSSQDAALTGLNQTVTAMILDYLNRDPRPADYTERANGLGTSDLLVRQFPITDVSSIVVRCGDTDIPLTPDQWDFDDDKIWRTRGEIFPKGRRNVAVSYSAGLDPMPRSFKLAAIYTARAITSAAGVDLNSSGKSWAGVSSQAWNAQGPGTLPTAAITLIRQYRATVVVL